MTPERQAERQNVYLAAAFERKPELQKYRVDLLARGLECTSSWLDEPATEGLGTDLGYGEGKLRACAATDLRDVYRSNLFVVFSGSSGRGGRHVETGAALARGLTVIVVGERENVFHYLDQVIVVRDWPAALESVQLWRKP